jgi:hypothetical protein
MPLAAAAPDRVPTRLPSESYARRDPQQSVLYHVLEQHLPDFLEQACEHGGVPGFVQNAFQDFLSCGVLAHGCVAFAVPRVAASGW